MDSIASDIYKALQYYGPQTASQLAELMMRERDWGSLTEFNKALQALVDDKRIRMRGNVYEAQLTSGR